MSQKFQFAPSRKKDTKLNTMLRNVNPVVGNNKWYLSKSWDVHYSYKSRKSSSSRLKTKGLGQITRVTTKDSGQLGAYEGPLLILGTNRQGERDEPFVVRTDKLDIKKSIFVDTATKAAIVDAAKVSNIKLGRKYPLSSSRCIRSHICAPRCLCDQV